MYDVVDQKLRTRVTVDGRTWVLRRLGFDDQLRVSGRAVQLLGGTAFDLVSAPYQIAAHMRATIEVATVQAPPEFDWGAQADGELLSAVWDQYRAWEDTFRPRVADGSGDAGDGAAAEPAVVVPPNVPDPAS